MELAQGARDRDDLRMIKRFLAELGFTVLPLTENIGHRSLVYIEEYGLSAGLRAGDAIIAATAVENALPLMSERQALPPHQRVGAGGLPPLSAGLFFADVEPPLGHALVRTPMECRAACAPPRRLLWHVQLGARKTVAAVPAAGDEHLPVRQQRCRVTTSSRGQRARGYKAPDCWVV